jgi:hypothetical protein
MVRGPVVRGPCSGPGASGPKAGGPRCDYSIWGCLRFPTIPHEVSTEGRVLLTRPRRVQIINNLQFHHHMQLTRKSKKFRPAIGSLKRQCIQLSLCPKPVGVKLYRRMSLLARPKESDSFRGSNPTIPDRPLPSKLTPEPAYSNVKVWLWISYFTELRPNRFLDKILGTGQCSFVHPFITTYVKFFMFCMGVSLHPTQPWQACDENRRCKSRWIWQTRQV